MAARLKTTGLRIVAAALLGYLVTATVIFVFAIYGSTSRTQVRIVTSLLSGVFLGAALNLPGAIAWAIMHRRGAGLGASVICGGVIGAVYAAGVCLLIVLRTSYDPVVMALGSAAIILIGAVFGAIVSALTWWVAYPRELNTNPADAFV